MNNKNIKELLEDSEKLDNVRLLLAKLELKIYDLIEDKSMISMKEMLNEIDKIYKETI